MISVIMPLYNAEKYIDDAISSIQNQTYSDFELLCINDASTDLTKEFVEGKAKQDPRIKLIDNPKRMGAAFSRNIGMSRARGEYLSFLDGDDYFEPEMLEEALECAMMNDLDIVIFGFRHVPSVQVKDTVFRYKTDKYKTTMCRTPFKITEIPLGFYAQLTSAAWNKLFRKGFIDNSKVVFQQLTSQNDVYFSEMTYLCAERIMELENDKVLLHIRDHETADRISHNKSSLNHYYACKCVMEQLLKEEKITEFSFFCYKAYYILAHALSLKDGKELYNLLITKEAENIKKYSDIQQNNDSGVHILLNDLIEKEYEIRWFDRTTLLSLAFERTDNPLWNELTGDSTIAVWGAGKYGKMVIFEAGRRGIIISKVFDKNAHSGDRFQGIEIEKPNEPALQDIDIIVVAIADPDKEMIAFLRKTGKRSLFISDFY